MNDTRIKYIIKVKQTVPLHELHRDDIEENPTGTYTQWAMSEDEALDDFHADIPIACLDDFEITCVAEVAAEVERDLASMKAGYIRQVGMSYALGLGYGIEPKLDRDLMEDTVNMEDPDFDESDMADIRNYEELDPSCRFTLDIVEAMQALHGGKKVQCSEWDDNEYIWLDDHENLIDESEREIGGGTLIMNRDFDWRIVK